MSNETNNQAPTKRNKFLLVLPAEGDGVWLSVEFDVARGRKKKFLYPAQGFFYRSVYNCHFLKFDYFYGIIFVYDILQNLSRCKNKD